MRRARDTVNTSSTVRGTFFLHRTIETRGRDPCVQVLLTGTDGLAEEQVQKKNGVRLRADLGTDMHDSCR